MSSILQPRAPQIFTRTSTRTSSSRPILATAFVLTFATLQSCVLVIFLSIKSFQSLLYACNCFLLPHMDRCRTYILCSRHDPSQSLHHSPLFRRPPLSLCLRPDTIFPHSHHPSNFSPGLESTVRTFSASSLLSPACPIPAFSLLILP